MEIFKQFGVSPILIVANIVNFVILLAILQRFLYKPVLKMLEDRKEKIRKGMQQAEEIETRLAKAKEEQEAILKKANVAATELFKTAQLEAKEMLDKTRAEAKEMAEQSAAQTKTMLEAERTRMMNELKGGIADMVVATMSKLTNKTLDSNDRKKLILEAEKEIKA